MDDGGPETFLLRNTCPEDFQGKQQEGLKTKGKKGGTVRVTHTVDKCGRSCI